MESFVAWASVISLLLDPPLLRMANDRRSPHRAGATVVLLVLFAFQITTLLVPVAMLFFKGSTAWQVLR